MCVWCVVRVRESGADLALSMFLHAEFQLKIVNLNIRMNLIDKWEERKAGKPVDKYPINIFGIIKRRIYFRQT